MKWITHPFYGAASWILLIGLLGGDGVRASDWPQWRFDCGRTAASPQQLANALYPQWTCQLPKPQPVWPKYPRMNFSQSYEPVVAGGTIYVPSMITGGLMALDTATGRKKWTYFTNGSIRLAPVVWQDRIFVGSDDGYLYCLSAKDGRRIWSRRGAVTESADRWVLGNDQLASLWPIRGGPVVADGVVYFAAGIWPDEGISIVALDAATGNPLWHNTDSGRIPKGLKDHGGNWTGGLSPQGYLTVVGDHLVVPSGRAMAGLFNRKTGKRAPYTSFWGGRENLEKGVWFTAGLGDDLFVGGDRYDVKTGRRMQSGPASKFKELGVYRELVLTSTRVYASLPKNRLKGYRPIGLGYERIEAWNIADPQQWQPAWSLAADIKVHMKAGTRLYGAGVGFVAAIETGDGTDVPRVSWQADVDGTVTRMLAADDKLFVVTQEGRIYAFGPAKITPGMVGAATPRQPPKDAATRVVSEILRVTKRHAGYCVVRGAGDARLVEELARQSELRVIVVDENAAHVGALRKQLDARGLHWPAVAVRKGTLDQLPPYLADLVVSASAPHDKAGPDTATVKRVFRLLHPYRGVACWKVAENTEETVHNAMEIGNRLTASVVHSPPYVLLRRGGGLPGAADWSHVNADSGGTLVSNDLHVQGPLTVLWFGGECGDLMFPDWDFTHAIPAPPLVAGGRIFIQVYPKLHAVDIYTGRYLWEKELPRHPSRRTEGELRGTEVPPMDASLKTRDYNYVATEDSIHVVADHVCLRLDAATGATVGQFTPPENAGDWRDIRVWKQWLLAATAKRLVCMNRHTGTLRWQYRSHGEVANFVAGNDRVFCADAVLPNYAGVRRGIDVDAHATLIALRIEDGQQLWRTGLGNVHGQTRHPLRLAYSEPSDTLVAVYDSFNSYTGADGKLLCSSKPLAGSSYNQTDWKQWNQGQPMLFPNRLIGQYGAVYDPRTGQPLPEERLWNGGQVDAVRRGCSRIIASQNLIFVRSANVAFWNRQSKSLHRILGIRPGCTNNMIPAGGVLNLPNFAYGCSCNYAIFTSLSMVPRSDVAPPP